MYERQGKAVRERLTLLLLCGKLIKNKERRAIIVAVPGTRIGKKEKNEDFYTALLTLKTEEELYEFFCEACTQAELRAMEQRFEVARLLRKGMIYSEILERTGTSSATISRVGRTMGEGYERAFTRMEEKEEK